MEHSPGYHKIGHKARFKNFKKIEIIPSMLSDHSWYETRNQLQGESQKIQKCVGIKQHAPE